MNLNESEKGIKMTRYAHELEVTLLGLKNKNEGTGKWWVLDDLGIFLRKNSSVMTEEKFIEYMDYRAKVAAEEFDEPYFTDIQELKPLLIEQTRMRLSVKQPGELLDGWILKSKIERLLEDPFLSEEKKEGIKMAITLIDQERCVLDLVGIEDTYGVVGEQISEDISNGIYQNESAESLKKIFSDLEEYEEEMDNL